MKVKINTIESSRLEECKNSDLDELKKLSNIYIAKNGDNCALCGSKDITITLANENGKEKGVGVLRIRCSYCGSGWKYYMNIAKVLSQIEKNKKCE